MNIKGIAAGAAMTAAAVLGVAGGTATADTFVPLPGGEKAGPNGKVARVNESALISPSMSANGAGRVAWVTGQIHADVTQTPEGDPGPWKGPTNAPGTNNSSTHGSSRLSTGYIVGCQVSIAENAFQAGIGGTLSTSTLGGSGSLSVKLGPGEVKFVHIEGVDIKKPGPYWIDYKDVEMNIEGCGGFAQARSYTVLEIIGDHYSKSTLYGAPFSIG
ncbi:MspA family porin [Nocardia flavorosea]|uniref:MspA family protein n=1 Tax=Nocardia flavorosea TaxID=53429 RepID=A0A846YJG3_9NOCA|nr:MspA family porin [Nocardia flavorosea]NKY57258.1 mspA family protein [Nocardia flavorosea]